jgi:hypothetical protein
MFTSPDSKLVYKFVLENKNLMIDLLQTCCLYLEKKSNIPAFLKQTLEILNKLFELGKQEGCDVDYTLEFEKLNGMEHLENL